MCAHSSSANDIVSKISQKLYPFIVDQFRELDEYNEINPPSNKTSLLNELVQTIKHEFESLRNYETKLVFPSVQELFDTKNNPNFKSTVNVQELQQLTQKKEEVIRGLLKDLQREAASLHLIKGHPVYLIINVFTDFFFIEKEKWHRMLNSWNSGCACFAKANCKNKAKATHSK